MVFKLFSHKASCGSCGEAFEDIEPIHIKQKKQIRQNLLLAKFRCPKCDLKFHGKCGNVGSATPNGAIVSCAGCKHKFQQELPFIILKN